MFRGTKAKLAPPKVAEELDLMHQGFEEDNADLASLYDLLFDDDEYDQFLQEEEARRLQQASQGAVIDDKDNGSCYDDLDF